jgi:hypothetical protein
MYTGQVLMQETHDNVVIVPGTPGDIGVSTDDHTPPFPMQSTLFTVKAFQVRRLAEDVDPALHYEADDTNNDGRADGAVRVKGLAGCGSPNERVMVMNLMNGRTAKGMSDDSGAFAELSVPLQMSGNTADIIIVTIGQSLVEPQTELQVAFSRSIGLDAQGGAPIVVERVENYDKNSYPDSGESYVPVNGRPVFAEGSGNRVVRFETGAAFEAGETYRVTFPRLADEAGDPFPPGFEAYFTVRPAEETGSDSGYGLVRSMARLGSLLFVAAEAKQENGVYANGITVLDVSNPSHPSRVAFMPENFVVRGLSVTSVPAPVPGACPDTDSSTLLPTLVVIGGGEGPRGRIEAYEILNQAPYLQWMGSNGLCCSLMESECTDSEGDPYAGVPFSVETFGQFAFASTMGVGVQGIDLATLCQRTKEPQCYKGEPRTEKLGSRVRSLAKISHEAGEGETPEHTLFLTLAGKDLRVLDASSTLATQIGSAGYPAGGFGGGRLGMAVAEKWPTFARDAAGELEPRGPKDLLFVADGAKGVAVFDVTSRNAPWYLRAFALVKPGSSDQPDNASDASLDPISRVLYVSGSRGLWIYDISHLEFRNMALTGGVNYIGLEDGFAGPCAPNIDGDTGLAYSSSGASVSAYQMKAPRVSFVTEKAAQRTLAALGATELNLEEADGVAALDEINDNSPRIAAFVPGGAGQTLAVDVISLTKSGNIRKAPAGNNPPTQLAGSGLRDDHKDQAVILTRQSDDITDPKFNLYLSDPIIATYNQNKDAASSPAPTILAAENAVARLSLDNPANQGVTWLNLNQRLAARTISPYLGVDFVDMEGNSLPAIDAMSLEMYQKAQAKHDNPNLILGTITITNPMGVTVDMTNGLSQTAVDTISVSVISHPLDCNTQPTVTPYTLVETDVNSLKFKDSTGAVELDIDADPAQPLPSPLFDPATPDELSVTVTAPVDGVTLTVNKLLLETGLDTRAFSDTTIEAHLVLGNRELPANQTNTITGTLRNLLGQTDTVTLTETAAGSRTFTSADGATTLQVQAILDLDWHPVAGPTPDTMNFIYAYVTDPTLKAQNSAVLLTEEGDDSPDYQNYIEKTEKQINGGYGEDDVPTLDTLNTQVIPAKKFYVEVHNPSMKDGDQVTFQVQDEYGNLTSSDTLALRKIDALRSRNAEPIVLFGGPEYIPTGYAMSKANQGSTPQPPGTKGVAGAAVQAAATDSKGRTHTSSSRSATYVAIGDSLTAGFQNLVLRQDFQGYSYPQRLANLLGIQFTQPLIGGNGIPGTVRSDVGHRVFELRRGFHPLGGNDDGARSNQAIPDNLGLPGSAIWNIASDREHPDLTPVCSETPNDNPSERMRQVILTNQPSPSASATFRAPNYWADSLGPSLLTIWAGSNDVLGIVSAPPGGMIVGGPANNCVINTTDYRNPSNIVQPVAQNLSTAGFDTQYDALLSQVWTPYANKVGPQLPDVIVGTIPPVTAAATLLQYAPNPYSDFDQNRYMRVQIQGVDLTNTIRQANLQLPPGMTGGKISLLAQIREIPDMPISSSLTRYKKDIMRNAQLVFGTPANAHQLSPLELLGASNEQTALQAITGFNQAILGSVFRQAAISQKWREMLKGGRIHVFDAYRLLSLVSNPSTPSSYANDPASAWSIVLHMQGVPDDLRSAFLNSIAYDESAVESTYADIKGLNLDSRFMGGLFSMDGVHPTNTGYAAIANCLFSIMRQAANHNGNFGGFSATALSREKPYFLYSIYTNDPLRKRR